MENKEIIEKSKEIIRKMDGVLKVERLSNINILNLIDIESNIDINLVPIINDGMKECFRRDVTLVIFKKGNFRIPPSPTVLLINNDGKILGHDIFTEEEKEKFENDDNALFLSEDFVVFRKEHQESKKYLNQECFILPPVDFPELEVIDDIKDIISSSPSTHSDEYLKKTYGFDNDSSIATILVAYSFK